MLCPFELRPEVVRAAGLEPATSRLEVEGTPVCASGRFEMSRNGTAAQASSVGCEATVRTRTSWFRARRGTSSTTSQCFGMAKGLDGEIRTPNPRLPTPVR